MSTNNFKQDDYVKCPYYCKEDSIHVKCVGIYGSHSIQEFHSIKEKKDHKDNYCIGYYWNCLQYLMLVEEEK